jgi:MFS family permease
LLDSSRHSPRTSTFRSLVPLFQQFYKFFLTSEQVLPTLAKVLHVSDSLINLTLTSYMIFQGLAPTIFGDLADMAGRRPAYIIGFVIYIGANIGIALQDSYAALFVLRCLQSSGSSSTIALASGVVADISTTGERGTWMGWVTSGPMFVRLLSH